MSSSSGAVHLLSSRAAATLQQQELELLGAPGLVRATTRRGGGQVLAVVDTGVAPLPYLFGRPDGTLRVSKWTDVSGEGRVRVSTARVVKGTVHAGDVTLDVGNLAGGRNEVMVGQLPSIIGNALGLQGSPYFVLVDALSEGRYDGAILDTNGDLDLTDETTLLPFNASGLVAWVKGSHGLSMPVVVTEISDSEPSVTFGFDVVGHGTGLAAIAAASDSGGYCGVAPEASLISIKAVQSDGTASWASILKGVQLALDDGADVILVGSVPSTPPRDPLWDDLQREAEKKGSHIVMPAGNNGPGVGTLTVSAHSDLVLVAGGYFPAALLIDGELLPGGDRVYSYSSFGPDQNGNRGISIVAPAVGAIPLPDGEGGPRFRLIEGTSVSSAFTAGGVALLRSVANLHGPSSRASDMSKALLDGASRIPGAMPVEQGSGKIHLVSAWNIWKMGKRSERLSVGRKWDGVVREGGLWVRDAMIGGLPIWMDNFSPFDRVINISTTADWVFPEMTSLNMAAVSQREVWLRSKLGLSPGFYSADVSFDDPETPGVDADLEFSATIPLVFDDSFTSSHPGLLSGSFPVAGGLGRAFFQVPSSANGLALEMRSQVPGTYYLYSPSGYLAASAETKGGPQTLKVGLPQPGIWQICFLASPGGSKQSDPRSVVMSVTLDGVYVDDRGTSTAGQKTQVVTDRGEKTQLQLSAPSLSEEWRIRQSGPISSQHVTMISYPEFSDDTQAVSLRLGTATGSTVRGYLYKFDGASGRWVEVAATSTGDGGVGNIMYPNPEQAKYVAYIEGFGGGGDVYAEMDAMVLRKGTATKDVPVVGPTSYTSKMSGRDVTEVRLAPRANSDDPKYVVVLSGNPLKVVGVVERASMFSALPIVQILGGVGEKSRGTEVQTLRAWTATGAYPLDLALTVGSRRYQLDQGKISAVLEPGPVTWRTGQDGGHTYQLQP